MALGKVCVGLKLGDLDGQEVGAIDGEKPKDGAEAGGIDGTSLAKKVGVVLEVG